MDSLYYDTTELTYSKISLIGILDTEQAPVVVDDQVFGLLANQLSANASIFTETPPDDKRCSLYRKCLYVKNTDCSQGAVYKYLAAIEFRFDDSRMLALSPDKYTVTDNHNCYFMFAAGPLVDSSTSKSFFDQTSS